MATADELLKTTAPTVTAPATPSVATTGVQALTSPATSTPSSAATTPVAGTTGLAQSSAFKPTTPPALPDSVAEKVAALSAQDSPLMQQAKTDGLKTANRRGLLNSSMAVGAAQDATLRSVLPIASQDASQNFQKNMQATEQTWQSGEKVLDRTQQTDLAKADRDLQAAMQDKQISAADRQQLADIKSREGLAAAERALQELTQSRDIANQQGMQDKEIGYQTSERKLDRVLQEQLAGWNLKSTDRNAAAQLLTNMQAAFQDSYSAIMANTNLDAPTREAQIVSAKNLRDKNLNLVEQMYAIDLKWTDADFAPAAGATPAAAAPVAAAPAATAAPAAAAGKPTAATIAANAKAMASKKFDNAAYLKANPDVANNKTYAANPAAHYARYGKAEGRVW